MVNVAKNPFSTNTNVTRTDITNLSPNTTYQVKVRTVTVDKLKSGITTIITTQSRGKYKCHQ